MKTPTEEEKTTVQKYVDFLINYVNPLQKKHKELPSPAWCFIIFKMKENGELNNHGVKIMLETYYEKN